MSDIFDQANRPARDLAQEWFSFKKVGDKIGGVIKDIFEMPARDAMPAQRCFTLLTDKGAYINVGLKRTPYMLSRTDNLQVGDELGILFEKEIPPKSKGFHPAKSMTVFSRLNGPREGVQAKDVGGTKEIEQEEAF